MRLFMKHYAVAGKRPRCQLKLNLTFGVCSQRRSGRSFKRSWLLCAMKASLT